MLIGNDLLLFMSLVYSQQKVWMFHAAH